MNGNVEPGVIWLSFGNSHDSWGCFVAFDGDTRLKIANRFFVHYPFDEDMVGFVDFKFGMSYLISQVTVVGQKHETLRVVV